MWRSRKTLRIKYTAGFFVHFLIRYIELLNLQQTIWIIKKDSTFKKCIIIMNIVIYRKKMYFFVFLSSPSSSFRFAWAKYHNGVFSIMKRILGKGYNNVRCLFSYLCFITAIFYYLINYKLPRARILCMDLMEVCLPIIDIRQ